jgi:hypothetical protein
MRRRYEDGLEEVYRVELFIVSVAGRISSTLGTVRPFRRTVGMARVHVAEVGSHKKRRTKKGTCCQDIRMSLWSQR